MNIVPGELAERVIVGLMPPRLEHNKLVGKVLNVRWKPRKYQVVPALLLGKSMFHGTIGLPPSRLAPQGFGLADDGVGTVPTKC